MITFSDLLNNLQGIEPSKPLIFKTDQGDIGAGYHVTELRHSISTGVDCGGHIETWNEARLQILDGQGAAHMSVGKFSGIIQKSLSALPDLAHAPFLIEFGHNNSTLTLKSVEKIVVKDGAVIVALADARAVCKPAQRDGSGHAQSVSACCGKVERCCA